MQPPGAMVTLRTSLSAPPRSNNVPATTTSRHPLVDTCPAQCHRATRRHGDVRTNSRRADQKPSKERDTAPCVGMVTNFDDDPPFALTGLNCSPDDTLRHNGCKSFAYAKQVCVACLSPNIELVLRPRMLAVIKRAATDRCYSRTRLASNRTCACCLRLTGSRSPRPRKVTIHCASPSASASRSNDSIKSERARQLR